MKLTVRQVALESPWEAWLFPTDFPALDPLKTLLGTFVQQLTHQLDQESGLERQVFVHSWKMQAGDTGRYVNGNLATWLPEIGLGVWPDRPSPGMWTEESFMDASADKMQQREPDLPAYRLLRLAGEAASRRVAASMLFGAGAVTQMFHEGAYTDVVADGRREFLPAITAAIYTHERYYMPLLDTRSLRAARSSGELSAWLGRARVYLRESAEDGGVLLVARRPMHDVLKEVAISSGTELRVLAPVA